jgi:hypothetical protein
MHADSNNKCQYAGEQTGCLDAQAVDVEGAADEGVREGDEIGGEGPERGVAKDKGEAECPKNRRVSAG